MKIYTTNREGQKIEVNYEQRIIEDKAPADEIVIETYPQFRMCVKRMQEEKQFVGGGDRKYEKALNKLVVEHHDLYEQFYKKLREQYNESR